MKRLFPLLAAAALFAIPAASAAHKSAPTLHPGKLVVGLNPPAVGFQVGTLRGNSVIKPSGFEIDLAKAIAAKLGIKFDEHHLAQHPWETLFRPGTSRSTWPSRRPRSRPRGPGR